MLFYRLASAAVLVPLVLGLTYLGGVWFLGLSLTVLTLAGVEYAALLKGKGFHPSPLVVVGMIWVCVLDAGFPQVGLLEPGLALIVLGAMAWALVQYERGQVGAIANWAWALAGGLYLGWTGAHFVLIRDLGLAAHQNLFAAAQDEGLWWATLALATGWFTDMGAFIVGKTWGRHKLSPFTSPLKTWEGFIGGLISSAGSGVVIAALIGVIAPALGSTTRMQVLDGLALGALIGLLSPIGDLGESLIKRYVGAKDSGNLIPGHGGMFDRIDSLLWAAVIGFYYAAWAMHR